MNPKGGEEGYLDSVQKDQEIESCHLKISQTILEFKEAQEVFERELELKTNEISRLTTLLTQMETTSTQVIQQLEIENYEKALISNQALDSVKASDFELALLHDERERWGSEKLEYLKLKDAYTVLSRQFEEINQDHEKCRRQVSEKKTIIDSLNEKISVLENQLLKNPDDLDSLKNENRALQNRLEISEGTRKAVHETTISILKQAQADSAKLALAHHETALTMLRQELLQESKAQTELKMDLEFKSTEKEMHLCRMEVDKWKRIAQQKELEMTELATRVEMNESIRIDKLKFKVSELESEVDTFRQESERLSKILKVSKQSWPIGMHHYESLVVKIGVLENNGRKRESEISSLISSIKNSFQSEFQVEKNHYISMISRKDQEIHEFKVQLDSLLSLILELQRC